ncbi:MAG: hypothetical protein BGO49_00675 [Planctomycetales bacterium 71-10]|nr:MAG: hypothetical protein BGO49_00675 [Planctomycetales bacterium 71-10]
MPTDVTMPVRDVIAIVDEAGESDAGLAPEDLANLRRLVGLGDEDALVAFVLGLRDKARSQVRRSLVAERKSLERAAAEADRVAASRRLDYRIRGIAGLTRD